METIKKIGCDDLNKIGIILDDSFITKYGIKIGDKLDIDDFLLIDGGSNGK